MKGYDDVYRYIIKYFDNKNYFDKFEIKKTLNGFSVNLSPDIVFIENDEIMGWHCYGDVRNIKLAEIIEYDLEIFLDSINVAYYFQEETCNAIIYA